MKTIKIIDLLNKIANGEEVPRLIKYIGTKYTHNHSVTFPHSYTSEDGKLFTRNQIYLNDEVEILDEEDEFEDIEELNLDTDELLKKVIITAQDYVIEGKINELIKNQKKIIERLKDNERKL